MVIPIVKRVTSPDVARGDLPPDPEDCAVLCEAEIGPRQTHGADLFHFTVVTPRFLLRDIEAGARWGRGYLLVDRFSWSAVDRALEKLLLHAHRPTWLEAAGELSKELHWEFENYAPEV